jgi:hypothetical protein
MPVTLTAQQWAELYAQAAEESVETFEDGSLITKREFDRRLAEAMRPAIDEHREGGEGNWSPRGWLE